MFKVRKHKGRSGKSVFEYRVYRVLSNGSEFQLAKYRTEELAQKALEFYQTRELEHAAHVKTEESL